MRTFNVIAGLLVALSLALCGCDKRVLPGTSTRTTGEPEAEVVDVATLDKLGDEELEEPNKSEARRWLKVSSHSVFEADKPTVIKFVEEFYAAGAKIVYVTGIERLGGTEVTASLLLVLPKEAAARAKVFEVAQRANEAFDSDSEKDIGQKYLSFTLD